MKPLIDILRIGPRAYAYRISARFAGAQQAGDSGTFDTLERCLFDAGAALGHYFASVELRLDGRPMGGCATESLRREPAAVARRLRLHPQTA